MGKKIITIFVSISYNINIYHNINLPLMGTDMLSTFLMNMYWFLTVNKK